MSIIDLACMLLSVLFCYFSMIDLPPVARDLLGRGHRGGRGRGARGRGGHGRGG